MKTTLSFGLLVGILVLAGCRESPVTQPGPELETFLFGADLSYVNQILDFGGQYKVGGVVTDPYKIFKENGANLVRLRLWHTPAWTKEIYGEAGVQYYSDLPDVEKAIRLAKHQGLQVLLNFHYSDTWADPANQKIPAAWSNVRSISVLEDSVYRYTFKTLEYLRARLLLPEFVQIGNETNCGMLYTDAQAGFPACNGCDGQWVNLRTVINAGIRAIRDVAGGYNIKIMLHVADPKNVDWWFTNLVRGGDLAGFDIIGFSYYPLWHTTVTVSQLSSNIALFKSKFNKNVIMVETAYPWTIHGNDSYNNIFGGQPPLAGFPYTNHGQLAMMKALTREVIDGGGIGIVYWEPAWISSDMTDLWGTGSSWENNTFFDFNGELNPGIQFMTHGYQF